MFSDGTNVLGADNKAAISVIMTLLATLTPTTLHGDIFIAFVPDEEIGLRGAKALDLARFAVDFAYTIDGCERGEVVYENFNAAAATVVFTGITAHPMATKGVMVNPILMAHDFIGCFDRAQTPETTALREGYFGVNAMSANAHQATLTVAVRDFDRQAFNDRKQQVHDAAAVISRRYPSGDIAVTMSDIYSNISNALGEDRGAIDLLLSALDTLAIAPQIIPMRDASGGGVVKQRKEETRPIMPMVYSRNGATLLGGAAILLWSTSVALMRDISKALGAAGGAAMLYSVSTVFLLLLIGWPKLRGCSRGYLCRGELLFVVYEICLALSLGYASDRSQAIELSMINYLWPCLTLMLAIVMNGQRAGPAVYAGLLLSLFGIGWLMCGDGTWTPRHMLHNSRQTPLSYTLAFSGAIVWALYCNVTRKYAGGKNGVAMFFLATSLLLWLK